MLYCMDQNCLTTQKVFQLRFLKLRGEIDFGNNLKTKNIRKNYVINLKCINSTLLYQHPAMCVSSQGTGLSSVVLQCNDAESIGKQVRIIMVNPGIKQDSDQTVRGCGPEILIVRTGWGSQSDQLFLQRFQNNLTGKIKYRIFEVEILESFIIFLTLLTFTRFTVTYLHLIL